MSFLPATMPASPPQLTQLLQELREDCYSKPKEVDHIKNTPFFKNCLHIVYGLSKSGKSYSIAQILSHAGMGKDDVIWLDADYNINAELLAYLDNFTHLNINIDEAIERLLSVDGDGKIVIFDSLKDFAEDDLDTNAGAQKIMENIREFTKAGYTVIVIAHATQYNKTVGKEMKIKGNAETIISKCDVVYFLDSTSKQYRTLKLEKTRVSHPAIGDFRIYSLEQLRLHVKEVIENNDELTLRELVNKLPSSVRETFKEYQDEIVQVKIVGKKHIVKCIQP